MKDNKKDNNKMYNNKNKNKNKKKKKNNNNKKIRGDISCFKDTDLDKKSRPLQYGPLIEDDLIELRNIGKAAFGARMKLAASLANVYVPISEQSLNIVLSHLNAARFSPNVRSFADCLLFSYNGNTNYKLNNPKCTSNKTKKALKHGAKDCLKGFDVYFKPIQLRITKSKTTSLCDNNIVGKYIDIKVGLSFTIDYIYNLYCGEMPDKISVNVFNQASKLDANLSIHYNYDSIVNKFILDKNKNCKYSAVTQECATYLICNKHK